MTDTSKTLKYGAIEIRNAAETLALTRPNLGQCDPQHYPHLDNNDPLGPPLTIREAASLLGCSVWAIRQRYLPLGLPHFRIGNSGKFTFYRNQIIRWVLNRQLQKGGRR